MNTKRLISTLLVSFVCILLASSFVLQASADTIKTVASLQNIALTSATFRADQEENQAELDFVDALNITETNPYETGFYNSAVSYSASGYGSPVAFNRSDDVVQVYVSSGKATFVYPYGVETFVTSKSNLSGSYYPCFCDDFYAFQNSSYCYLYDYDNNLLYTLTVTCSYVYCGSFDGYNFVILLEKTNIKCYLFDSSFNYIRYVSYRTNNSSSKPSYYQYGKNVYIVYLDTVLRLDLETLSFSNLKTIPTSSTYSAIIRVGNDFFIFRYTLTEYLHFTVDSDVETISYPISFSPYTSYSMNVSNFLGNIYIPGNGFYIRLVPSKQYYYDPLQYTTDSTFEPDRFISFKYLENGQGTENGGGFIGIDLDFGVPDSFYSANEVTGFQFEALVMSYARTSDAFVYEDVPLPFVLDIKGVNLNVVPTYSPKLVGKVGDVYLYNFTVILFLNGGTITDLNIKLNQYIPAQRSTHWFSIPVSALTLNRWEDTSSGGDISGGGGGNVDLSGIEAELATIKSNLAYVSSVAEETNADVVIIKDSIGDLSDQIDGLYSDIDTLESKIDAIAESLGSLTSVPEDHSNKMEDWWGALTSQDNQLGDMSNAIDGENSFYDDLNSYYEPYLSSPELDPSFEGDISATLGQIGNLDSGEASTLFAFLRNMWTVHPLMLSMSSVVVFLGIIGMYVRSA